ncbi:hypothetical protein [Roseovarius aestuarii]|uniref:Stress response protein n=1 Tax=Roseovarius aestuarii TaxID=475083 RepID=A0A1X7BWY1_9RHOB|nr:hypothetical protein [Roseovarius aestuarii]SMC14010.1 hypothetical protein ROA7745_03872 [Roseovarius aestuarii]
MSKEQLPDYLKQGEAARLFPVLSTTSKEGRTTSIVLACLCKIDEFGAQLLASVGQKVGKRASIETYTEVVFQKQTAEIKDRPDGLIALKVGSRQWRALVEAKVGNSELDPDQIERYRVLAKDNGVDCVISISNQFATSPDSHPVEAVRKSRSKIPVFHWSWMHILTTADLLVSGEDVADIDQLMLLNELRRFLTHESAGVKGFDRMPKEWSELNKLISSGGAVPAKSPMAQAVLEAWHQETRDLSMILSRMTGMTVAEKLPRKHIGNPAQRQKDELGDLRDNHSLNCTLTIPDAAAPIEVTADVMRRSVDVGMTLRAPDDKKSTKARVNWLLRQIKATDTEGLFVRLLWPGGSEPTQYPVADLREDPDLASEGKEHLASHGFHIFLSERLGGKFTQQTNFISELERIVPKFYGETGANLAAWVRKAPQIKSERSSGDDVSPSGIAEDAEGFEA